MPLCVVFLAVALVLMVRLTGMDHGPQRYRVTALLSLCMLLAGHGWAMDWAAAVLEQSLPASWVRQDIWVQGQVVSLVTPSLRGQRFILRVDAVCLRLLPEQCDWSSGPAFMTGANVALRDYSALELMPGEH